VTPVDGAVDRLLVRGADLLVLGVGWNDGLRFAGSGHGQGRLEAVGDGGRLTLVFPPQAVAEAKYEDRIDIARRGARLAGPSRVSFSVAAGTAIDLTVEGLLAALGANGQAVHTTGATPTSIELPWHLTVAPQATSGADVVSEHASAPVSSPAGVVGLWHAAIHARGSSDADAGLFLLPLEANQNDDGLDVRPLSGQQRQSIVDAAHAVGKPVFPQGRRLELSALGGTLSAALSAPSIEWNHVATLGRDHYVRVVEHGVLYPFGHRVVYVECAERTFHPDGSPAVAGLRREELLLVTEPVRSTADGDLELRRRFPFSEVELLTTSFPDIKPPAPADYLTLRRPVEAHGELGEQLGTLTTQQLQLIEAVNQRIAEQPATLQAFIEQGMGSTFNLLAAQESLAQVPDPVAMEEENRQTEAAIDQLERALAALQPTTGPEGETIPPDQGQIDELRGQISGLIAQLHPAGEIAQARANQAAFGAAVTGLQAVVQQEFEGLPRTLHDAALQQDQQAMEVEALGVQIDDLNRRIQRIAADEEEDHPLGFIPRAADGQPLRFPLRCAAASGDVSLAVPLVFVKDFTLAAEEFFPEFHSLTDRAVADMLRDAWAIHAEVPLPGVTIDMVNSGQPQPGDVHEVHALTLAAVPHEGGFRPSVTQFEVVLPALRALLPDTDAVRTLHFTDAFLTDERIPELPFAFDPTFSGEAGGGVVVDFVAKADRSGGLVAPRFLVDGISRRLGPVAAGALPPALADALPAGTPKFDLASVYEGATLLGFPLASLLKLPADPLSAATDALPLPPAITQLVEGSIASGMRMSWTLDLDERGPFRPGPDTKLVLTVEHSNAKHETTCTVNDFSLVLPPDGTVNGLLTLKFRSLAFSQRECGPPDLKIEGLELDFGGALQLLQELQDKLQAAIGLPDNLPQVDVHPTGLTASYAISAPHITAGAFQITNIAMRAGVDVPFDGKPVTVSLSFATKDDPFNVSVLAFGGGGYLEMTIGPKGVLLLEASIDFGASLEVDFFIAKGEVHALGGVRFRQSGGSIDIDGFLSIGGSVEVLGLVSVSIELLVMLSYRDGNRLVGRATIVVEIDLTLFSDSVEIDSGEWILAGSEIPAEHDRPEPSVLPIAGAAADGTLEAWKAYREAFAAI
jgi:hypothetical protein